MPEPIEDRVMRWFLYGVAPVAAIAVIVSIVTVVGIVTSWGVVEAVLKGAYIVGAAAAMFIFFVTLGWTIDRYTNN